MPCALFGLCPLIPGSFLARPKLPSRPMQTAVVGTTGFAYADSLATRMPDVLHCVFKALQNTSDGLPRDHGACQQTNASGWCGIERCGESLLLRARTSDRAICGRASSPQSAGPRT